MWQEHQKKGMQAFLNGDNDTAILHWKSAVTVAKETNAQSSPELAELNYCLGKALSDLRRDEDALEFLRAAVDIYSSVSPGDSRLNTAQYAFAEVLRRTGGDDEADKQYKQALEIDDSVDFVAAPLKEAIKELQKVGLAKELKAGVLTSLCHQTGVDIDGDNSELPEVLIAYYTDPNRGPERVLVDRLFYEHLTQFDIDEVLERLCEFAGCPDFLVVEDVEGDTADGEQMNLTMRRSDGELVYRASQSVVGVVDEFNEQLAGTASPFRFCSLNVDGCFMAFLLDIDVQKQLHERSVLDFDMMFS